MHDPKPVGIWMRAEAEAGSAERAVPCDEERRARDFASARGWVVLEVYRASTVASADAELGRLQADVARRHVTGLIVPRLAWLAASRRALLAIAGPFRAVGADLVALQEGIDTTAPDGRFLYAVEAMAQWEREATSERTAVSVKERAGRGQQLGGVAPFGYRWERGGLVPDPPEATVRRLMYELFLKHGRKKTVARLLNQAGHRTRRGAEFTDTTVDRLLRDPTAKGWRRANHTRGAGRNRAWTPKPSSAWVWSRVEPIVSEEVWDRVNRLLEQPKARPV